MKAITSILLLFANLALADPIPARDPFLGESLPTWWWDIWHGRVVVLEGKITFKALEEPDIRIQFNKERVKEIVPDEKTRELQAKIGDFYVGELEISKFHYADAGASDSDGNLKQMKSGETKRVKVLIPIMRFGEDFTLYGMGLEPDADNVGIHVLDYNNLILGFNFAYSTRIPNESLMDAQKVFKLREKLVHIGVNRTPHPDKGYAGFFFRADENALFIQHVIPGTPASDAGLRAEDKVLSVNGEEVAAPDHESAVKFSLRASQWKVGDKIEIEVQRGEERHKLRMELISSADFLEHRKREQSENDESATAPESMPGENEKATEEEKVKP